MYIYSISIKLLKMLFYPMGILWVCYGYPVVYIGRAMAFSVNVDVRKTVQRYKKNLNYANFLGRILLFQSKIAQNESEIIVMDIFGQQLQQPSTTAMGSNPFLSRCTRTIISRINRFKRRRRKQGWYGIVRNANVMQM